MCVVGSFMWQCVLLYVLGGNVCHMFEVAMCCFFFLRGKMSCWVFLVAVCVVGSLNWECVLLGLLCGNVCCCMF